MYKITSLQVEALDSTTREHWEQAKARGWVGEIDAIDLLLTDTDDALRRAADRYSTEHDDNHSVEEWVKMLDRTVDRIWLTTPGRDALGPARPFDYNRYRQRLNRLLVLTCSAILAHQRNPTDPRPHPGNGTHESE